MDRRQFLKAGGLALGGLSLGGCSSGNGAIRLTAGAAPALQADDWNSIRAQFPVPTDRIHLRGFFLACVPHPVRAAIARHAAGLDDDSVGYWLKHHVSAEEAVRRAAGQYLGVDGPTQIALTDSTTMGLGLVYSSLRIAPGQEILTSEHDHPATQVALEFRVQRSEMEHGAAGRIGLRRIRLYEDGSDATVDRIVETIRREISPRTRVLAMTWVHSVSGVKLPIRQISAVVDDANRSRQPHERVLFCLDGVHAHGVEDVSLPELGCDYFAAGSHKWICGPRGTGIVWSRCWDQAVATITPFGPHELPGSLHTPGGFHTFENRWAADEAYKLHLSIGRQRVERHIHTLSARVRDGLADMPHVRLVSPRDPAIASGITCFDVKGMSTDQVVERLALRRIMAATSPYTPSHARVATCLWNTKDEVDEFLRAMRSLSSSS